MNRISQWEKFDAMNGILWNNANKTLKILIFKDVENCVENVNNFL